MTVKGFFKSSFSRRPGAANLRDDACHTITICEATPRASLSQDSIEIKIKVDTIDITPPHGPCRLHDPFSQKDHKDCDWYLGRCLRESKYDEDRADRIFPTVKGYGVKLMNRLDWHGHTFKHPNINIDILQGRHRTNKSSIYHIHWEHLEQVQKQNWPGLASNTNPLHVRVRRVLDPPMKTPRNTREDVYKPDKKINVLLVIARKLKRGSSGLEDLSPAMVYRSIMKVKKVFLPKEHSRITLNLEVVRPGSFVALADHLERKKAEHGTGFFHLVHFDLHGEVSGEDERQQHNNAYLSFASPDSKLNKVPATKIAELLHDHDISCVVLTACESGKANKGDDANLCRIFAEHGVSQILAISFGIHWRAVEILCDSFYHHLLVSGETFSESARHARLELFDKPERQGTTGRTRDLEDWFIPVAYVPNKERPFIRKKIDRPSTLSPPLFDGRGYPLTRTLSSESARSNISFKDLDVEMDVEILKLEEVLMRVGNVLLRGPIVKKNSELVDRLLNCWVSTGLLEGFDNIDAKEFFSAKVNHDQKAKDTLAKVQHFSKKGTSKKLRENYISKDPEKATKNKALRKAAIKLTSIDKLFPKEKATTLDKASELKVALERFERFLDIVILGPKAKEESDYKLPFLIIVGEDSEDVLTSKFISRYANLGLEAVFRDQPFNVFLF